ncbi:MAG: glucodextranase DOMON-like domain-containing protein [Candidatus Omnitrophota bacterium]
MFIFLLVISVWLGFTGCNSAARISRGVEAKDGLYLNLVWHHHQPLYYKEPETGVYTRPWVRVHATKDYYDMAAMLKNYPKVKATFNLTPVLIKQLDDFGTGAKDKYWVLSEKPAGNLTQDEKRFILTRFFDANHKNIIGRFPGYRRLLEKKGGSSDEEIELALQRFTEDEYRDLQVWFNLAWFDPDFLAQEPLKHLVAKDHQFVEKDKAIIFKKALEIIKGVVPLHKAMQVKNQIEVITTPYAHPILPLIFNTNLALKGDPGADMPERFSYPQDAIAQLKKSVEMYKSHYGRKPRGLWPAEGAVAQETVKITSDAGYTWMASGEHVLAKSLNIDGFTRGRGDLVQAADALYRPYYVRHKDGPEIAVVFRDIRISDLVGFEYSGKKGEAAAEDFMKRLEAIRLKLQEERAQGPHLVSVILDGENAWEYYPNDGKEFLNAFYQKLSDSKTIKTITVSEYLEKYPEQRELDYLWPGAWFSSDYGTWIGEQEEKAAWDYLGKTRNALAQYDFYKKKTISQEKLNKALDFMYLAEGSDWFWWFGSDQNSGVDEYFDYAYRSLLMEVYKSLGEEVPDFLNVPIIPKKPVFPVKDLEGQVVPVIDGTIGTIEWDKAGLYREKGGTADGTFDRLKSLYYGLDAENVYFRVDFSDKVISSELNDNLEIYFSLPSQKESLGLTRGKAVLGFRAGYMAEVNVKEAEQKLHLWKAGKNGVWQASDSVGRAAGSGNIIELSLPLEILGGIQPGDDLLLQAVFTAEATHSEIFPAEGPVRVVVPEPENLDVILSVDDPSGDDHGPGSYVYPTDQVFEKGVFDIKTFSVAQNPKNLIISFTMNGPVKNVWGSAIGLSVQTFDLYIDIDPGAGTGARQLLEGRNASTERGAGWDYALWVEGWNQKLLKPGPQGLPVEIPGTSVKAIVIPPKQQVLIIVPKSVFGERVNPEKWGYIGLVLSQDGFPSPGVRRVRDVEEAPLQWRIGGGLKDTNHTRIMDVAWPDKSTSTQEVFLKAYRPSMETNMDLLKPEDFAQIPLVIKSD